MAITLTPFEIDRWNDDDQAIATLGDAHWNHFFSEPSYGRRGVESRKHKVLAQRSAPAGTRSCASSHSYLPRGGLGLAAAPSTNHFR
jgi:hypothetical protein